MDIGACKKRLFDLSGGRGMPLPFKAFPLGGRWIAEAIAKARRMRGRGMTERNVKDNPSSVATRQIPKGKPYKVVSPHSSLGSLTLTLAPPPPKGEGISGYPPPTTRLYQTLRLSPDTDTTTIFSTLFVGFADGRAVRPRTAA